MQITFLGTTCMVPTKERNHTALLMRYSSDGLLFDCGEGTQRQIKMAGQKLTEVTHIFLSHWHGDHVLGLPGLIQSLGASEYAKKLIIFGPEKTKEHMRHMYKAFVFDRRIEIEVNEIEGTGIILETPQYQVEAYPLEHGVPTYGFRFIEKDTRRINVSYVNERKIPHGPLLGRLQRGEDIEFEGGTIKAEDATYLVPGKKVGIIQDTVLCQGCLDIAKDVDLLISEASYDESLKEKAEEYKHMTAQQAAQVASQSGARRLVMSHISARYKTPEPLEKEARTVFKESSCAYDLMKIKL